MTAARERTGDRAAWLVGLLNGALLAVPGLVFGIPGMAAVLLLIAATAAVFRRLAMLSGMLVGAGGLWAALLIRQAILICSEPDRPAGEACPPSGLAAFVAVAVVLLVLGAVVGEFVGRRHSTTA